MKLLLAMALMVCIMPALAVDTPSAGTPSWTLDTFKDNFTDEAGQTTVC